MNSQDIIFGTRPVLEAIKSGKTIEKLFLQKNLSKEIFNEIKNNLKNRNVNISFVTKEKLNRITKKNQQYNRECFQSLTYLEKNRKGSRFHVVSIPCYIGNGLPRNK